jgi:hypothetical protein
MQRRNRGAAPRERAEETALPGAVTFQAAVVLMLCHNLPALTADAWAASLERVEFESASQRLVSGKPIPGERIGGELAKPGGAGPFAAVVGLHGCAGMHEATRQKLADALVAWASCSSTAMQRVASTTPAHRARLRRSSGAGRMPTGLYSS